MGRRLSSPARRRRVSLPAPPPPRPPETWDRRTGDPETKRVLTNPTDGSLRPGCGGLLIAFPNVGSRYQPSRSLSTRCRSQRHRVDSEPSCQDTLGGMEAEAPFHPPPPYISRQDDRWSGQSLRRHDAHASPRRSDPEGRVGGLTCPDQHAAASKRCKDGADLGAVRVPSPLAGEGGPKGRVRGRAGLSGEGFRPLIRRLRRHLLPQGEKGALRRSGSGSGRFRGRPGSADW